MIIKRETQQEKWDRITVWHKVYCWLPKFIDGAVVWFDYVERRANYYWGDYIWEYRLPLSTTSNEFFKIPPGVTHVTVSGSGGGSCGRGGSKIDLP